MGCSLFSNSHFQMGVTVMGFAEHFGPCLVKMPVIDFRQGIFFFDHSKPYF